MKYFIKTFGCQQNHADSERLQNWLEEQGGKKTENINMADCVVINSCMIRQSAENRVFGLINNLGKLKTCPERSRRIILTGCMVGLAFKDKTGKYLKRLKEKLPAVDNFLPIEEIGFSYKPVRKDKINAFIPISNGCNNFCTYCVVPYTRGREISRPYQDIIKEATELKLKGYKTITLLGQNVNSYGADCGDIPSLKPIYVKHLGRYRIPTLFPYLLEDIAKIGFEKVDFISSNPWDFSDELINIITRNKNITRTIHLPVQSGDDRILKRMNRWYTAKEYLLLISKIKKKISRIKFTTDIIVGFCGETEKEFNNTVKLCKKAGFSWAYISIYSSRPFTAATKVMKDDVPYIIKKKRWQILEDLINKPHLKKW